MTDTHHDYFNLPPDPTERFPMKKPATKAKRKPRPPGTMAKAWETRRRNQQLKAQRGAFEGAMNLGVPFTSMPDAQEAQRVSARMFQAAATMNETLYGDTEHSNSFIEQYKTVVRYKEYLENLGFKVSYDPF